MMRNAVALFAAAASLMSANAIAAATHTVTIDGLQYAPESVTVKAGERVVWINKDPFPHTVTVAGQFDSHEIAAGKSWQYTPRKRGDYPYICTLHPTMRGTLKVE